MRILIATDAFPPVSGGSGWSTYELARGLRARGHHIVIVQPYDERLPTAYGGFNVIGFPASAPSAPFVRNYFRNERLYRRLSSFLTGLIGREQIDLIHAQHELTGPASIRAAHAAGIPSVCTIRDYWPLCYWNDLVVDPAAGDICPACSPRAMTRCLPPRVGRAWPIAAPFIPYMRSNLKQKQRDLAGADAVIAVSHAVAAHLRARADLSAVRIEVLPNGVDVNEVRAHVSASSRPLDARYALFIGKLARNKGAGALVDVVRQSNLQMPLVVVGDGPERASLIEAAARANVDVKVLQWLDRQEVFRWLGHAALLIFPSNWPEPLSRVLIEASALCVPIAAMNTGGTPDVIVDEETGLLSTSADELAADVSRLALDEPLRVRLGAAAGKRAEAAFDVPVVVGRVEALYDDVLARHRAQRGKGVA
jgi:glycogen(starch) synthase